MVAITIAKRIPFPLNSRKENANAAREQEIICPMVIHPAMINEFKMNRRSGTVVNASLKFCSVGCFGKRFRSVVNNSLDGISAMLTAYKSGSSTRIAKMIFAARRSAVFSPVPWRSFYFLIPEVHFLNIFLPSELPYYLTDSLVIYSLLLNAEHHQCYKHDNDK